MMAFFEEAVDTLKLNAFNFKSLHLNHISGKNFYINVKVKKNVHFTGVTKWHFFIFSNWNM